VPILALLVFGFILSTEVKHLGLGVIDGARSPASRRLLAGLASQGQFDVRAYETRAELDEAIVDGTISVAVLIPPDFERDLGEARGGRGPAEILVIHDGAEVVLAGNAEGFLESMVASTLSELVSEPRPERAARGITVSARALFNPTLDGAPFMVAGTFGFVLTFVTTMLTAVSIVNERLNGTFEQLQVTPATSVEIILGKILPLGGLFACDVVLMVLAAGTLIGVWPAGSIVFFVVVSSLYVLISLAFGLLISATSSSPGEAVQKTVLFSFPLTMLSGFVFPIRNMPTIIQWFAELLPATHYIRFARAVYIRGAGFVEVLPHLLPLALVGFLLVFAARRAMEARA
jgi:ABC-2 type transport system permease protein